VGACVAPRRAIPGEAAPSADLGGSSKYSNESGHPLKTEVEKGSMRTAFGHGLVDSKAHPEGDARPGYPRRAPPKEKRVNILAPGRGGPRRRVGLQKRALGLRKELSFLFDGGRALESIRSARGHGTPAERRTGCGVRNARARPRKSGRRPPASRPIVPITASGLHGEKPLVERDNVGKGSRQNGSVPSEQGLALSLVSIGDNKVVDVCAY